MLDPALRYGLHRQYPMVYHSHQLARTSLLGRSIRVGQGPVLVAVGETDVVGGSGPDLAALIPGAKAFVIQGRDHMKAVGDKAFKEATFEFLDAQG